MAVLTRGASIFHCLAYYIQIVGELKLHNKFCPKITKTCVNRIDKLASSAGKF
jgi:hypothetical protein